MILLSRCLWHGLPVSSKHGNVMSCVREYACRLQIKLMLSEFVPSSRGSASSNLGHTMSSITLYFFSNLAQAAYVRQVCNGCPTSRHQPLHLQFP